MTDEAIYKRPHPPKIYALRRNGSVFYVGKSTNLNVRFIQHRAIYGSKITLEVLQTEYIHETPEDAERKWIVHYMEAGEDLVNAQSYKPNGRTRTIAEIESWLKFYRQCVRNEERLLEERMKVAERVDAEISQFKTCQRAAQ